MTALLKNGETLELQGWLVDAATPEIVRRARAAGVALVDPPAAVPPAGVEGEDIWDGLVPNLAPADPALNPAAPAEAPPAGAPPNFAPPAEAPLGNQPPEFQPPQRPGPPDFPPDIQQRIDEARERHEQRIEEMRERQRQRQLPGRPAFERPEPPDFNRPAGAF
jgi:hypothetical protein